METSVFTTQHPNVRVAFVFDSFWEVTEFQRVYTALQELFPKAAFFGLSYDSDLVVRYFPHVAITGSWLMKLPTFLQKSVWLQNLCGPRIVEQWDLTSYDLVITLGSTYAHGVVTNLATKHISFYTQAPDFIWFNQQIATRSWWRKPFAWLYNRRLFTLRNWNYLAGQRSEAVVAHSQSIAQRITKLYRRSVDLVVSDTFTADFASLCDKVLSE